MECSGRLRSSIWINGVKKYKDLCKKGKFYQMEHIYIYGYVAFALGVLSLACLVWYLWRALRKICQVPVR
jgi:hypothetical protein